MDTETTLDEMGVIERTLYHDTDLGNGIRFAQHCGDYLRYLWDTGQWLFWDGHRWNVETGREQAGSLAKKTVLKIYDEIKSRPTKHERDQAARWAVKSEADARLKAMISQSRDEQPISAYSRDFDTDLMRFNSQNWYINLKRRGVFPQHPEHNVTKIGGCKFDETAKCPLWDKCVKEWMGGDDKVKYLQIILGYCLTGDTSARLFPIFHGPGFNGKSVCVNAVCEILGDYATLGSEDLLAERKMPQHPTDIMKLKGKRLVLVDETKKNMRLRTSLVKRMTGDAELTGRLMRQDFTDFKITHKLILMTQNLPIINETSDAIWDRVHLLRWDRQFNEEERDLQLTEKLKAEYPGILNWLIKGCLEWQKTKKIIRPESVRQAGFEYRADSDPLGEFIEAKCTLDPRLSTTVKAMKNCYLNWAESENVKYTISSRNFNEYLRERGCDQKQMTKFGNSAKYWQGIGLQSDIE
jgi:putative DNA primase/helicase